jgi:PAS domain-containing protein
MISNSDQYGVVIGIGNYPGIGSVIGASENALAFSEWLGADNRGAVPKQNIYLLYSSAVGSSGPSMAHPQLQEIWRAFEYLGLRSGERVGKRLYLFIRGFGAGHGDDLSILTAEAQVQRLTGFNLRNIIDCIRFGGFFDELIVLAEIDLLTGEPLRTSFPLETTRSTRADPRELRVLALHRGHGTREHSGDAPRKSLAEMWLEAASGQALDPQGRVTGSSIAEYLRRPPVPGPAAQPLIPEVHETGASEIIFGESPSPSLGRLVIELPHWMATLRISNSLFQPVATLSPTQAAVPRDHIRYEVEILPGIYEVEAELEGSTERKTMVVAPGRDALIRAKEWKHLKAVSAAPLIGTATAKSQHIKRAEEWSHRLTWRPQSTERSGLFLFVRTLDSPPHPDFSRGLQLLDEHGTLVTDFSDSTKTSRSQGFMAFNARLKPGSYVLRRESRPGVRLRQQPLFMHRDWETQVFIAARKRPSLRSMTIYMARLGDGFSHRDATAVASEAVLDVLRHDSSPEILQRDQIWQLLRHEHTNPWLGILSAYVLQKELRNLGPYESARRGVLSSEIKTIIDFLVRMIGDHPDACALALDESRPADRPFWHPPLLRPGLKLATQHATLHRGTIPLGSLTECILGNLLTNSPWTAWRALDRVPVDWNEDTTRPSPPKKKVRTPPRSPASVPIAALTEALSPAAPVFPLKAAQAAAASAPAVGTAVEIEPLREAALIGTARALMDKVDRDAVPATVTIDALQLLAGVGADQLSNSTGASLERAERGLERLRNISDGAAPNAAKTTPAYPIVEQAAVVAAARAAAGPVGLFVGSAPEADAVSGSLGMPRGANTPPVSVTIEDVGSELRTAALRLTSQEDAAHWNEASRLSRRLQAVADRLLQSARFVVVTDRQGRFLYCNGATATLIETSVPAESRSSVLEAWQRVLSSAPLGRSELTSPIAIAVPQTNSTTQESLPSGMKRDWILDRTEVKDATSNAVQGYVNILRLKNALALPPQILAEIDSMRSELTLYSSLYIHGSESRDTYLQEIDSLTTSAEQVFAGGAAT